MAAIPILRVSDADQTLVPSASEVRRRGTGAPPVSSIAIAPASVAYDPAYAVPVGLKSTGQTDTTVSLSWDKSANVPRYRVQVYTKADMSDAVYYRFTESAVVIPNLVKSTQYKFRVRGISADGLVSLTAYSAAITATTAAAPAYIAPTYAVPDGIEEHGADGHNGEFVLGEVGERAAVPGAGVHEAGHE